VSSLKIAALIVVLTIALVAYRFIGGNSADPDIESTPPGLAEAELPAVIPEQVTVEERVAIATDDEPGCLTFLQLHNMPTVAQDAARLVALQTHGIPIAPYESFDESTLRAFADQGDSAAMVVIGATAILRAYNIDESLATGWLNDEFVITDLDVGGTQLSSDASLLLNEAAYWFYQAALHGRLFALQHYGTARNRLFGGPIGLGWISQDEFDELGNEEMSSLHPFEVYTQVAYDIAPQLREGLLADLSRDFPESDLQLAIRASLVAEFAETLADSGLQRVEIAPTASPGIAELYDQICSAELQEYLQREE